MGERTIRRVLKEPAVAHVDDQAERATRSIGRPSKTAPFRDLVRKMMEQDPGLMTLEYLRRARLEGYGGSKSAFYKLVAELRPRAVDLQMRFEGLPGEFSQHDFGQVDVRFVDGGCKRVHFFASRLKYSRWADVTLVADQTAETLVRQSSDQGVS